MVKSPIPFTKKVIEACDFKDEYELNVIVGPSNRNFNEIPFAINIHRNLDAISMIHQMEYNSLMICSPSTISYEACRVGIPLIIIKTAENQDMIGKGLVDHQCAYEIKAPFHQNLTEAVRLLMSGELHSKAMLDNQARFFKPDVKGNFLKLFSTLNAQRHS